MSTYTDKNGRAKDAILARVREALADVPKDLSPEEDTPVPWEYHRTMDVGDVLEKFVERVEDYKATVVRCGHEAVPTAIADALRVTQAESVVLPPGLPEEWARGVREISGSTGVEVREDTPPLTQAELNDTHAVVTSATVGAAEPGTIMLTHCDGQGRRALTLLPDIHVCVVRTDQVVSDIPEATGAIADAVRAGSPVTWISGGSATSDIELSRVEGVHGPRTLYVILAG